MASSGTVADPIVHLRYKPPGGKEQVIVSGYARIKNQAVIEAGDLALKTIKNFVATPYYVRDPVGGTYFGEPTVLYGSINTAGSLMNAVTLTSLKGSHNPLAGGVGTAHIGTVKAGTTQLGFTALGA